MNYTLRALLAIGLLAGFYVVGLAIVVALGYAAYLLTVTGARSIAGSVWILVAVVAFAIGRGIFSVQKRTHTDPVGHLVGEAEQPELWREVRDLAETLLRDPQADLARFGDAMYRDSDLRSVAFEEMVALAARSDAADDARVFLDALREREVPSHTLGGAVVALKEGRPEALLGLASRNDEDPDAARRTIASVLGDTIAHRLLDGMGERLDPWTPAYEALEADDAVPALEAWLDHHGVRRDLELPPVDRSVDEPPAEQRVRTPAPSRR